MPMSDSAPVEVIEPDGAPPLGSTSEAVPSTVEPAVTGGVPAGEACPPPLVWQEVLAAYYSESQPWEVAAGPRRLQGRTWGTGPSLYLLNGFAATAELYALMIWLLRDTFRCVVFDTIRTGARGRPSTMSDYAADVIAVAD